MKLEVIVVTLFLLGLSGANLLIPNAELGQPCQSDAECTVVDTYCGGPRGYRVCSCIYGYVSNEAQTKCLEERNYLDTQYAVCEECVQCKVEHSVCNATYGRCRCVDGYVSLGVTECVLQDRFIGDACLTNYQCIPSNSGCSDGICSCSNGYVATPDNQNCLEQAELRGTCEISKQCITQNTVCADYQASKVKTCQCDVGYIADPNTLQKSCTPLKDLGRKCIYDVECRPKNSSCENNKCECSKTFVGSSDTKACLLKKVFVGDDCRQDDECTAANSYCNRNTFMCECKMGFAVSADFRSCFPEAFCQKDDGCIQD